MDFKSVVRENSTFFITYYFSQYKDNDFFLNNQIFRTLLTIFKTCVKVMLKGNKIISYLCNS